MNNDISYVDCFCLAQFTYQKILSLPKEALFVVGLHSLGHSELV